VTGQGWAGIVIDNSYQNQMHFNTVGVMVKGFTVCREAVTTRYTRTILSATPTTMPTMMGSTVMIME